MDVKPRTGGRILVDQLLIQGVDTVFGVPGESYLEVLDALHDTPEVRFTVCRQEGGAAMMAAAWGELTGKPGVAFVTRGPGATNASAGVHIAQQDSLPMVLFVGQIDHKARERDTFQEVDYRRFFGGMAKWVAEIDDAARIPELVHRAFATAVAGRPGPVVLALPEDMLVETVAVNDGRPTAAAQAAPSPAAMDELRRLLEEAKRPFAILGGGGWSEAGTTALASFLDASDLPAACGFRRQDLLDNEHRCYAGHLGLGPNPKLVERVRGSDLLLVVGSRLGETTSQGFTLPDLPRPQQRLVHVHPEPEELGRYYQPDLAILSSLDAFAASAAAMPPPRYHTWATITAEAHAEELAWRTPTRIPGELQLGEVVAWLRAQLPVEAILTNGAGNYAIWANRHFAYRSLGTQLAPTSGSMGYGLPAAVAAKLRHPDRPVVCFAGDGCFLMTGQELATAVQYDLPIIIVVVDNGMYGTIRMHQERDHPGRVSGTGLRNPDFAALALAYGAYGARVETTEAFAPAFEKAVASGKPALLHLILDPEAITPRMSLSELRNIKSKTTSITDASQNTPSC